jgi:hypothetical protein
MKLAKKLTTPGSLRIPIWNPYFAFPTGAGSNLSRCWSRWR